MIYVLISLVIIGLAVLLFLIIRKKKAYNKIKNKLIELGFNILEETKGIYDFKLERNEEIYLIKIIYNFSNAEIDINSKNYFQINKGVVASRKKGDKLKNVYELINYQSIDKVKKIYLVYPGNNKMLKVINECEMILLDKNVDCYGSKFYRFHELD